MEGNPCTQYFKDCREKVSKGGMDKATADALYEDFSHRPTWCDAGLALVQVKRKKATGFKPALWFRSMLQKVLYWLGITIQRYCNIVLIVGLLILLLWCIGLRKVHIETNIDELWVEKGGRLDIEKHYMSSVNERSAAIEKKHSKSPGKDNSGEKQSANSLSSAGGIGFLVVIQTPLSGRDTNVLTKADLLAHVEMMVNISRMQVTMFGANWTMTDVCFKPDAPKIGGGVLAGTIQNLIDRIIPCVIITPLDCFWEGSFPHGPNPPLRGSIINFALNTNEFPTRLSWKNLDPIHMLDKAAPFAKELGAEAAVENIASMFKRIGLNKGYLDRPCIDPFDPDCPKIAPNYRSDLPLNFGHVFNGGCDGIAAELMQWAEDLIIGGVQRKAKGANMTKAEALESVILTASTEKLLERYSPGNTKKKGLNMTAWNKDAAAKVIAEWQRSFSNVVYNSDLNKDLALRYEYQKRLNVKGNITKPIVYAKSVPAPIVADRFSFLRKTSDVPGMFHPFGGESMNDMLEFFSQFNPWIILAGYFLMLLYAAFMLSDCRDGGVASCAGVAIAGVLLVTFASVGGLGCATVLGIHFNAATTNIVPFLTLGLGVDDMFLLVHNYKEISHMVSVNEMGYLLKETGLSVLLTSISNILSFAIGGVIPVPALRSFCWQVAIVLIFNVLCILTIYPAMLSIDLIRRKYSRMDLFCCIKVGRDRVAPAYKATSPRPPLPFPHSGPVDHNGAVAVESTKNGFPEENNKDSPLSNTEQPGTVEHRRSSKPANIVIAGSSKTVKNKLKHLCGGACLNNFVTDYYAPFLSNKFVKIGVLIFFGLLIILGIVGCCLIKIGLELTDIVPKNTAPYDFMRAREDYFSFYLFDSIIKEDFDYSQNQKLVEKYRNDMGNIDYIVKDEGTLGQTYWLPLFRKWIIDYQEELTNAIRAGNITAKGPLCRIDDPKKFRVSSRGLFAWELLVNEKDGIHYENFNNPYIIGANNIIRPSGFYNYLTAWVHQDSIAYQFSNANFKPALHPEWSYKEDKHCSNLSKEDIRIPPAEEILTSSMQYFVTNLTDTPRVVDFIKQARRVSEKFEDQYGLPNFPSGVPFTYWEQYIHLIRHLVVAIVVITICVFLVISLLLMNLWTAAVVTLVIAMMVLELAGFMGLIGLKMNPISGVTLVTAVGIAVEFTVHMALSFLTSLGDRNQRMTRTLEHMFVPVLHGGISTLLGILMLAFSSFEFIVRYVFVVLFALLLLGLLNGLILLPVLLSLIGPPPEVRPVDGSDTLPPPSPESERKRDSSSKSPPPNMLPMEPVAE